MSVARWLTVVSSISDHPHTLTSIDDFIRRLESELIKIQGLQCELPVCMLLLKDAIIVMREESKRKAKPVLQEFISSKKEAVEEPNKNKCNEDSRDKGDWLSSVQLWSVDARSDAQRHTYVREIEKVENRANMFTVRHNVVGQPYQHRPYLIAPTTTAKNVDLGGAASAFPLHMPTVGHRMSNVSNPGVRKSGVVAPDSTNRKQRRCWSQELHRSFVNALQQLGGAQVATPKQIRDLMRVDGLTNDEVKSHLQKYRLHARKGGLYESSKTEESPSKASSRRSGSPKSAFQFSLATGGRSTTGLDSMEDEHNCDAYRWKDYNYIQTQKGSILNNN